MTVTIRQLWIHVETFQISQCCQRLLSVCINAHGGMKILKYHLKSSNSFLAFIYDIYVLVQVEVVILQEMKWLYQEEASAILQQNYQPMWVLSSGYCFLSISSGFNLERGHFGNSYESPLNTCNNLRQWLNQHLLWRVLKGLEYWHFLQSIPVNVTLNSCGWTVFIGNYETLVQERG